MSLEIDNINIGGGISATTLSASTIIYSGQPIQQVFVQNISGGYFPASGGTVVGNSSFIGILSASTIISGGTNLYNIFSTTDTNDITRVQPGSNITTGGTVNSPIVNLTSSPSVNNLMFSGTAVGGNVQADSGTFTSFSAGTLSGGIIFSGGTNLYSIFAPFGTSSGVLNVNAGSNITTGGTVISPIINLVDSPSLNGISISGAGNASIFSATTISATTISVQNSGFIIRNSANTFSNLILSSPISGNTSFLLPLISFSDTFVTEQFNQSLTNKTINTTLNTITSNSIVVGDILKSNGTKYVRFGKGARYNMLSVDENGTDLKWVSGPLVYSNAVAGNLTTTSTSDILITGMQQLNVPSGKYLVNFGGTFQQSANGNQVYYSVFVNGSQITGSEMQFRRDNASDIKTHTLSNFPITILGGSQTASGSGGIANATTYGGAGNTNININFPALPVGVIITSTNVFISYTSNAPSYLSELRVRVTPPVAAQQTDLQPSTTNAAGTLNNILLTSYNTESPVGNWLFEFRETFNDSGVDCNITDITIECNYIDPAQNGTFEIRWRVNSGTGTITNRYFSLIKI